MSCYLFAAVSDCFIFMVKPGVYPAKKSPEQVFSINRLVCFVCLAQSMASSMLQKSSMMYLSKEATTKDRSLKTQVLLVIGDEKITDTEKIWKKQVFLVIKVQILQLIRQISRRIHWCMPIRHIKYNTIQYSNINLIKGDLAIYLDYVVLGELIPAKNSPQNLEDHMTWIAASFWGLTNVLLSSWSEVTMMKHFSHMTMTKANQTCFIRSLKELCQIYLAEPALKNISNLYLTNGCQMTIQHYFSTYHQQQTAQNS